MQATLTQRPSPRPVLPCKCALLSILHQLTCCRALKDTILMPGGWPMQGGLGDTAGLAAKERLPHSGGGLQGKEAASTIYAVRSGILSAAAGR